MSDMLFPLQVPGAELYYDPDFLSPDEADRYFKILLAKCEWQRHRTSLGTAVPRDEAYYGDPAANYTYSRRPYLPQPWLPELLELKVRVEKATPLDAYANLGLPNAGYNAALCNLYRSGSDSVGLHADAEPEMGPVIASVSLGAERLFRLKTKDGKVAFAERLPSGSLLIMAGQTQRNYKHEVPKEPRATLPRINLTFRRIQHREGEDLAVGFA
jgi:alkylated DNA repair dioxygenase AlkB